MRSGPDRAHKDERLRIGGGWQGKQEHGDADWRKIMVAVGRSAAKMARKTGVTASTIPLALGTAREVFERLDARISSATYWGLATVAFSGPITQDVSANVVGLIETVRKNTANCSRTNKEVSQ